MVSDTLVEEIRARADLVSICGEHTSLRRMGKSFRGPCPLHGGDGPNFSVDMDRGIFKCFVCGEGGDVFAFLMKLLGLDFPSAVRHVGERVGIHVPDQEDRRPDPHAHLREAAAFAAEWFQERLGAEEGNACRRYLASREIEPEQAEAYGLGYAPDAWGALAEAAAVRGIERSALLQVGLLATSERSRQPYDHFRNRLIFTILDLRDRPVGFGGRALGPASDRIPKYINSADSPIFHKGEVLYGLNWARHQIRREGFAVVVEGYTDVLSLHVRGIPVVVAGLGTAFTLHQAKALARYTSQVYLLYDSDVAGLRATFRAADVLLSAGLHPLVVTLPEGEDPDSMVRKDGPGALRRALSEAVDVLERKLQILERQGYLETVEGRRRAVDGLLSTLRAVRDPALRDIYLDRAAERTGVRRATLVGEMAREGAGGAGPHRAARGGRTEPREEKIRLGSPGLERNLLLLLLRDGSLVGSAAAAGVGPEHFRDPVHEEIYRRMAEAGESMEHGECFRDLAPEVLDRVERLLADSTELTDPAEIFEESVRRLVHRPRLERLREIDRELELAEERQARELLAEKQQIAAELRAAGFPLSFLRRRSGEEAAIPGPG